MRRPAPGPAWSGCHRLASRRYAAAASSAEEPSGSPSPASGSLTPHCGGLRRRPVVFGHGAVGGGPRPPPVLEDITTVTPEELELVLEAARAGTFRVDLGTGVAMRSRSLTALLGLPPDAGDVPVE